MLDNTIRIRDAKRLHLEAAQARANEIREHIRAWKQTLISHGRVPSLEAVKRRMVLEQRVSEAVRLEEVFQEILDRFAELAGRWRELQAEKAQLPDSSLSQADVAKLREFEKLVRDQLGSYGYASFSPTSIEISRDTYKPSREGFDIAFDVSASDNIRLIWAYMLGLLELARAFTSNHLGLVIFDEPQQQKMKDVSFQELVKRAATAGQFDQQVVFFTSEDETRLRSWMGALPHRIEAFDGKLLQRLSASD